MYIKAKVYPKSKKQNLKQTGDNRFEIKIKEKAEKNMANKKVIELIASHFDVEKGKVKIVNGHHSSSKLINVNIE